MASLIHQVPGFRSGKKWRQSVAVVGYIVIALLILGGFAGGNPGFAILGFEVLLLVLLASNAWGLRPRVPVLGSPNKLVALGGWVGALFIMFILLVAVSPRSSAPGTDKLASGSSSVAAPVPGGQGTPVLAAAPKATQIPVTSTAIQVPATSTAVPATRTPAPPTATSAPTATPSPESALAQAAQKQFGARLRKAELSPIGLGGVTQTYVTLDYDLSTQWDEGTTVRSCANDLKSIAPKIFAVAGVDALELRSFTEFKDMYGKTASEVGMKFTVRKEVAAKINWQEVNPRNFGLLLTGDAGGVYVHPGLRAAWNSYLAGK